MMNVGVKKTIENTLEIKAERNRKERQQEIEREGKRHSFR